MASSDRIVYVDWFRGLAIIYMTVWQVTRFFSVNDFYSEFPFWLKEFDAALSFPIVPAFAAALGAGLMIYLTKSRSKGFLTSFRRVGKRFFMLIGLSLVLSVIMWDFNTFFNWSEALQGVGVVGIFAFAVLYFELPTVFLIVLSVFLGVFQGLALPVLNSLVSSFPYDYSGLTYFVPSIVFNALFRGFFSVMNLLPYALWGAVMVSVLKQNRARTVFLMGAGLMIFSLVMHANGWPIDHYRRSSGIYVFQIGMVSCVFAAMSYLSSTRLASGISKALNPFGRESLVVYLANYFLVFKPLVILGLFRSFSLSVGALASAVFLLVSNVSIRKWKKM